MKGLKLSDLQEGHIYRCLLSGKNVQYKGQKIEYVQLGVKKITHSIKLWDNARYCYAEPSDYQLVEIKEVPDLTTLDDTRREN